MALFLLLLKAGLPLPVGTLGTNTAAAGTYSWSALYAYTVATGNFTYGVYWAPALAGTASQNKPTVTCTNTGVVVAASFHYFKGAVQAAPLKVRNSLTGLGVDPATQTTAQTYNAAGVTSGSGPTHRIDGYPDVLTATWLLTTGALGSSPNVYPPLTLGPTSTTREINTLSSSQGIGYYQDTTTGASNAANATVNNLFGLAVACLWSWTTSRTSTVMALVIPPAVASTISLSQQLAPVVTADSTGTPTGAVSATGSTTNPVVTIPVTPSDVTVATTSMVSAPTLNIKANFAGVVNSVLLVQATTLAITAGVTSLFPYTFTSPQLEDVPQYLPESNRQQVGLYRHFKRRIRNLVVALLSDYSTAQDTPTDGHPNSIPYPWNPNDPGGPFATSWGYEYPGVVAPGSRPDVLFKATFTTQSPYVTKMLYGAGTQNITTEDAHQLLYNGYEMANYGSTPQPGQVAIGYVNESMVTYG